MPKLKTFFTLKQRERQALALEAKIERAIETGDFIPDRGYLSSTIFLNNNVAVDVRACGCAIAAAAYVACDATVGDDEWEVLKAEGFDIEDLIQFERGYEGWFPEGIDVTPSDRTNPFWQAGNRLSRFHPGERHTSEPRERA